jgi:hypothetical protein
MTRLIHIATTLAISATLALTIGTEVAGTIGDLFATTNSAVVGAL